MKLYYALCFNKGIIYVKVDLLVKSSKILIIFDLSHLHTIT